MRYGLGQNGTAVQREPRVAAGAVGTNEIPYDYVATFTLNGKRAERVQDVITISTEGTFVAVSIGYSFVPGPNALPTPGTVPAPFNSVFKSPLFTNANDAFRVFVGDFLTRWPGIQFFYSIVDSGSGRELQNKPVHSLAGLGSADGHRPFRPFARPVSFPPRTTIRIEVIEISEGSFFTGGTLQIVLHGYKRLGE